LATRCNLRAESRCHLGHTGADAADPFHNPKENDEYDKNDVNDSNDVQPPNQMQEMKNQRRPSLAIAAILLAGFTLLPCHSAEPRGPAAPQITSPEVSDDRQVTFRIVAPQADSVQLNSGGDIPGIGFGQARAMTRNDDDVWTVTVGPLEPGAYRYNFNVDGVNVVDPRNTRTSESNESVWSLVHVPGADWLDTRNVPRGALSQVTYWSSTLERFRRLHVYTPPGYESGHATYPILYLLHGAFDSDHSWSSVGRAGFILDNLIAANKATPMVVVMPHGHTGPFRFGMPLSGRFEPEFVNDIMPQMEQRYRVRAGRQNRAIAGLSMGGAHTLNIGIPHLDKFGYLGVFSSGIFGITGGPGGGQAQGPGFEERHQEILKDAGLKEGLKLFWFATGRDDFLVETSRATVALFKKHGFDVEYRETEGAHTWDKWREYLHEFAQLLFK
jgi:enterochelin esterase-like enzyme